VDGVPSATNAQMSDPTRATGETHRMKSHISAWLGSMGRPQKMAANAAASRASVIANLRRLRGLYSGRKPHEVHCHRFQNPTGMRGMPCQFRTLKVRTCTARRTAPHVRQKSFRNATRRGWKRYTPIRSRSPLDASRDGDGRRFGRLTDPSSPAWRRTPNSNALAMHQVAAPSPVQRRVSRLLRAFQTPRRPCRAAERRDTRSAL